MLIQRIYILLFAGLIFCTSTRAQDYNYIHYTTKDGLASNTVYNVIQDHDGFMYFATDNGVSRFDGKRWKTYTVKDGLPDNEVLTMHLDSWGRLWLFSFNKKCCFIKNGKIYNEHNTEFLGKLHFTQFGLGASVDIINKVTYVSSLEEVFAIKGDSVKKIWPFGNHTGQIFLLFRHNKTKAPAKLYSTNVVFYFKGTELIDSHKLQKPIDWYKDRDLKPISSFADTCNYVKYLLDTLSALPEDTIYQSVFTPTNNGCIYSAKQPCAIKIYLPDKKIGQHFADAESNHWFSTMGEGVYKLTSDKIEQFNFTNERLKDLKEVFTVQKVGNQIQGGLNYGSMGVVGGNNRSKVISYQNYFKQSKNGNNINRLVCVFPVNEQSCIYGFDAFLLKLSNNKPIVNFEILRNKSIEKIDDNNMLISTAMNVLKVSNASLLPVDTIYKERSTYSNYFNNNYYVGTLAGLYKITAAKKTTHLGKNSFILSRRISCIKPAGNNLVVASADAGVVIMNNDRVVDSITEQNANLSSNSCKTLFVKNNYLYIGTNNGLNKYNLDTRKIEIKYTLSDGLPDNIINAIYVDEDSTMWVGTPTGISRLKEKEILSQSICNLVVERIELSGKTLPPDTSKFSLNYNDNIKFEYVGISFRSGDDMDYYYKLVGLNTAFNSTTERTLSYPSLPPGTYTMQLYAMNKFGIKSKMYTCTFTVNPPFWKTWWFYLLCFAVTVLASWAIIYWRYKRLQARNTEKNDMLLQMASLEQQALQSQMNPHFVFNCLNSIQQLLLDEDIPKANRYLILFSKLLRNTLDISEKKYITVSEEINYLQQYLVLEDLRFAHSFEYGIEVDSTVDVSFIYLPAMILQPFVENALRHGIRQSTNRKGIIKISFIVHGEMLHCTIEDNGIGRKAAEQIKSNLHVEYQSKGMQLTERRIGLHNYGAAKKISFEVIDMYHDDGTAAGTKVIVKIPLDE